MQRKCPAQSVWYMIMIDRLRAIFGNPEDNKLMSWHTSTERIKGDGKLKRPLMREDLKVIQYQTQETDNTFITSDGTSPYNSTRKWAVKCHYREDNN